MSYTTTAQINLSALQHNLARVRNLAPESQVLAMVKANAYGHGLLPLAHALAEADTDALGVARIQEALQLRAAGIQKTIVLMEGFFEPWELPIIAQHKLDIVVHQMEQVQALVAARLTSPIRVWLKLDSGMHRLGLTPENFLAAYTALQASKNVDDSIILTTHFACSDELDNPATPKQIQLFNEMTAELPGQRSLANSAAIIMWQETHADWVRPGIMLYGISPFADKTGIELGLLPVMTLQSRILSKHDYRKGEAIGYGGVFVCPETMSVGLIATGYGDGYPRHIPAEGTPVLVNGQVTQIIARVSMDMIYVDLRPVLDAKIGDRVILWGENLPIERIARAANTSAYELACNVSTRVEFVYQA
ncbi:MAG: alanine racemase [Legionellales bacterium]|nr:alanine racemase [Legionellales bacterium]